MPQVVRRAEREDLNARVRYQVAFMRNSRGEVVPDRRFNTGGAGWAGRRCRWHRVPQGQQRGHGMRTGAGQASNT